jgi:hypothetical protein
MKTVVKLALCIVALIGIMAACIFISGYMEDVRLRREGKLIVEKVERFRTVHGQLPSSLSDIGVSENELFYTKRNEGDYIVWYGKRLGESGYYDSRTKTWDVGG